MFETCLKLGKLQCKSNFNKLAAVCKFDGKKRQKIPYTLKANSPITKPPLLQESRVTCDGSPNLVDLKKRKVPIERKWELRIVSIIFTNDCTLVLYKQLIPTGFVLLLLPLSSVLGFPLYKNKDNGRAATHQLYSFAIWVWFRPMQQPATTEDCSRHRVYLVYRSSSTVHCVQVR